MEGAVFGSNFRLHLRSHILYRSFVVFICVGWYFCWLCASWCSWIMLGLYLHFANSILDSVARITITSDRGQRKYPSGWDKLFHYSAVASGMCEKHFRVSYHNIRRHGKKSYTLRQSL